MPSRRRPVPLLALAAALALPAAARGAPPKIGVINSITGPEAPIGEHMTNGIKLALEDLKAAGKELQVVWEDDAGKPPVAMSAFEKLATRDEVLAVVGPYSSAAANVTARVADRARVPLLIPLASKEEITRQGYQWVFRLSPTTADRAAALIDMALALGEPRTVAILNESTDFGSSVARSARAYAEDMKLKVVFEASYSKGSPDFRATLVQVRLARPDLVIMGSYVVDAILVMRQAREVGLAPQAFLGAGAGFALSQFAQEREVSENVYSSVEWAGDVAWPGAADFARRYQQRFGRPPTYHSSGGYQSTMIIADVAYRAGGDRSRVRALLREGAWEGITGRVRFANWGGYQNQNKQQMLVQQVRGGKHETVWPPEVATARPIWPFPGWK